MYDYIIIDTVNFAYRCSSKDEREEALGKPKSLYLKIGNRVIFPRLMKEILSRTQYLKKKYLKDDGGILFLFDNYTSREELKASLVPATSRDQRKKLNPYYKANRNLASLEFYATLDLIHYYFKMKEPQYMSARIPYLEADDLLPTAVEYFGKDKKILVVSSDSDWCKVLSPNVQVLADSFKEPLTIEGFYEKNHYFPSEEHIKLEKMIYGDKADNVEAVFSELTPKEKKYALNTWDNVIDFLYESQSDDVLSKYAISFKDKEREIRLAYKMLSTIPVDMAHFKSVLLKGRKSDRIIESIESALGYLLTLNIKRNT